MAKYSPRSTFIAAILGSLLVFAFWRLLTGNLRESLTPPLPKIKDQAQANHQGQILTIAPKSWENTLIPPKVWQTSKDPIPMLDEKTWSIIKSWTNHNPQYRHELLTSDISDTYVREKFPEDHEIKDAFLALRASILRADLIRYLVLYADGGIYNDIDVKCLKPVKDWLPSLLSKKASIIVGIEVDTESKDGSHKLGFASWTIMAKPRHPAMEHVVRSVITNLNALAESQKTDIANVTVKYDDVIGTTGPRAFTQALLGYLSQVTGTTVNYLNFTGITEPTLMEDIVVLPINSFGSGQGHSGSGSPNDESALAQHLWMGSWKKKPSDRIKSTATESGEKSNTSPASTN